MRQGKEELKVPVSLSGLLSEGHRPEGVTRVDARRSDQSAGLCLASKVMGKHYFGACPA